MISNNFFPVRHTYHRKMFITNSLLDIGKTLAFNISQANLNQLKAAIDLINGNTIRKRALPLILCGFAKSHRKPLTVIVALLVACRKQRTPSLL